MNNRLCYEGCHVQSLVRMGEPVQSFDMRSRTKAGHPVWLNVSILSMNDAAGEKVAVHLFLDVTATKELLRLVHERLSSPLPAGGEPAPVLSRREIEVLRLMVEGLNTTAAAERLHVSHSPFVITCRTCSPSSACTAGSRPSPTPRATGCCKERGGAA